jgi:transposase-like protein
MNYYDRQFKIDAVSFVVNAGRGVTEVARDLGIAANVLYH